jgi:hypothetical protein
LSRSKNKAFGAETYGFLSKKLIACEAASEPASDAAGQSIDEHDR